MARPTKELEQEMLSLPSKERARLAHELIVSLDEEKQDLSQDEWQTAWLEEAKRREARLNSEKLQSHKEVMDSLKNNLKK